MGAATMGRRRAITAATHASRNVVLVVLESVGALAMGLYNGALEPDTMPLLRSRFAAAEAQRTSSVVERVYVTEPNTLHTFYALHCGIRPHLGVMRREWDMQHYHNACLPRLLRDAHVHSALFSTSHVSLQRDLDFDSVWSSMASEVYDGATPRARYNWLGHDDFEALPHVSDYVERMGERRFFLSMQTVNTHSPYRSPAEKKASGGKRTAGECGRLQRAWAATEAPKQVKRPYSRIPRSRYTTAEADRALTQYELELRCADVYIERLFRLLERAGRLHDTTVMITSDHGEGFMQSHMEDVSHGGTVYDTQARIPLLIWGPAARRLPPRVHGVWSDTSVAHTVLDALGLPPHPLTGSRKLRAYVRASADRTSTSDGGAPLRIIPADVLGPSVLSHWRSPPTRAFVSCAFDRTCVGLKQQKVKWVLRPKGAGSKLEAYAAEDGYDTANIAHSFSSAQRRQATLAMRSWQRAVNALHFPLSAEVAHRICPFAAPYALASPRRPSANATLCCAEKPEPTNECLGTQPSRAWRRCHKPPCIDNRQGIQGAEARAAMMRVTRKQGVEMRTPTPDSVSEQPLRQPLRHRRPHGNGLGWRP